jgi:serine/threonine-protein kinase ULK/ATG1
MKDNLNSIKFYEYYDTEKEYAIVMELCDNNLQNILNEKKGAFNIDEVYDIISQLNNTFKIISENNIVHRDLKLENILVKYIDKKKSEFIVKLTDYGVSRKVLSISKKCNTYVGTVLTMAPEILAGEKYDNKCDLWSLGVIIYQLLFKEYPYDAETEVGLYNQINEFGDKYFKKTGEKQIDCLISKLLVKDPEKRLGWNDYFSEFSKIKKNNSNDNNNCQIF